MTDTELFNRTRIVLAATLALPLIVGLLGLGGASSTNPNEYIKAGTVSDLSKPTDEKVSDKKDAPKEKGRADKNAKAKDGAKQKSQQPTSATGKPAGNYTVKAGDTYGRIAENYYGSFEQWPLVYGANAGGAGYGEYDLAVGAKVALPAISTGMTKPATNLCD